MTAILYLFQPNGGNCERVTYLFLSFVEPSVLISSKKMFNFQMSSNANVAVETRVEHTILALLVKRVGYL